VLSGCKIWNKIPRTFGLNTRMKKCSIKIYSATGLNF
jgi:hypothetical protein